MNGQRSIYLVWKQADHEKRYVVGRLTETDYVYYAFSYEPGNDLDEAHKKGFQGYPSFPLTNTKKIYDDGVIQSFALRLPARTRIDFKHLLEFWEIKNSEISDFDLLSITGGRLPTDNFEFIDPHLFKRPNKFLTYLAGFKYHADDSILRTLKNGVLVELEREPNNHHDQNAVKVIYMNNKIGYINRVHAATLAAEMDSGKEVKASIKNVEANGVIYSVLLRIELS